MTLLEASVDDAIYLSRFDRDEVLSAFSAHGFDLDDCYWPTVEHYYQAMKYENPEYREEIRLAESPEKARELGHRLFRRKRRAWKALREILMTRAVYTKCRTYSDIAWSLRATGNRQIVETSQYDYYWGCGRDRRGKNTYGKVLMKVRAKLVDERAVIEAKL